MRIAGAGCCLIDSIYMNCSYQEESFCTSWSRERGDGGLIEGGLVFREDIEEFTGKSFPGILESLTGGRPPDIVNLGGPAIIALVHAAQMLMDEEVSVSFHGATGDDENARIIRDRLSNVDLEASLKILKDLPTSTTDVFDDPSSRAGKGERSFINTIGAAGSFTSADLPDSFFDADIVLLGGTALVPAFHDELHTVLRRVKEKGGITIVGTVYDFRNEKAHPDRPWPLGGHGSYRYIDLLVTDQEEALRLSGREDIFEAAETLISFGIGSLIITRGALDILLWSGGSLLQKQELTSFPVSAYIDDLIAGDPSLRKDTTGCGDNFMGGVLVSFARQLSSGKTENLDLIDLCAWGASSGGFTCMYHGGMYDEKVRGEKAAQIIPAVKAYKAEYGERL